MRVFCPSCGEQIPGAELDLRRNLGVCRPCGEVVALPTVVRDGEGNAAFLSREIANLPLHAYRPLDMKWKERKSGLRFHFELVPSREIAVYAVVFALIWNTFLLFWFTRSSDTHSALGILFYWFPVLHLAAGGVFLHNALCMLMNHAEISLSPIRFTFVHRPLPQSGEISEATRTIRCVIDAEQLTRGVKERWFIRSVVYSVTVLFKDGRQATLNLYLPTRMQARYLALRLNRALDELRAAEPPEVEAPQAPANEVSSASQNQESDDEPGSE